MPKIKVKKYDATDFSKILDEVSVEDFAIRMHKRLVTATRVLKNGEDADQVDSHAVKKLLADYPSLYSWAMVEARLIKTKFELAQEEFESQMKIWFGEYSESMGKETQKAIDAAIYADNMKKIDSEKKKLKELEAKQKISQDLVSVWQATVHTLQSLSKQVSIEIELSKMRHKHGS